MKSKKKWFYCLILSNRDIISFIAGIIVSGYVVNISIQQNFNKWHFFTIIVGLIISVLCFILFRISENFGDNIRAFKNNNPEKSIDDINIDAWTSINSNNDTNKILWILPKIWLPLITAVIPSLFVIAVLLLSSANIEIKNKSLIDSKIERSNLINQFDSLVKNLYDIHGKNEKLNDSIDILNRKIYFKTKQIDCLLNIKQ